MAFVTVEGRVDKAFNGGLGFAVVERWQVQGEDRKRRWAVWFDESPTLVEGQHVKVSGTFSSKIREYEDQSGQTRRTVDHNLNRARVLEAAQEDAQQPETTASSGWATAPAPGSESDAYAPPADDPWADQPTPF